MTRDFTTRVLSVVRRIPPGRVATYGDIAAMAGRPRAARAVGNIMKGVGRPDVPAHRVIAAGGRLGGYGGNQSLKRALLVAEGVVIRNARIKLDQYRWQTKRGGRAGRAGGAGGQVGPAGQVGKVGERNGTRRELCAVCNVATPSRPRRLAARR